MLKKHASSLFVRLLGLAALVASPMLSVAHATDLSNTGTVNDQSQAEEVGTAQDEFHVGNTTITVTRVVLVSSSSLIDEAISTDKVSKPFTQPTLPLVLNASNGTALLPAITARENFQLPPSSVDTINSAIPGYTTVTSTGNASGTFTRNGSITFSDVPIHLKANFVSDFPVKTLTTESVAAPGNVNKDLLKVSGFTFDASRTNIVGSRIDADGKVSLVGVGTFTNTSSVGLGGLVAAGAIGGTTGVFLLEGVIK